MRRLLVVMLLWLSPVILKAQAQQSSVTDTSIHITIDNNKIYNTDNYIGRYVEKTMDGGLTYLKIYAGSAEIAEATYADGDENWTIITPVDQNKMYFLYDKKEPLQQLFKYLIIKKYL